MATTQPAPELTGRAAELDRNRRQGYRHSIDVSATVVAESNPNDRHDVQVTVLSINGIGLHSEAPLVVGEVYRLRAFDTLLPAGTRMKVIGCRSISIGGFDIGGEIVG